MADDPMIGKMYSYFRKLQQQGAADAGAKYFLDILALKDFGYDEFIRLLAKPESIAGLLEQYAGELETNRVRLGSGDPVALVHRAILQKFSGENLYRLACDVIAKQ